jgi:two-component sensor histidine kinase
MNSRVRSMAMIHEKLYGSADLAHVEFSEYVESLLDYIWKAQGAGAGGVRRNLDLKPVRLPVNVAVPGGLILNELFSNAFKHAFRGRDGGTLGVSLREDAEGMVCLVVHDDGVGLPPSTDWETTRTLGLRIVKILARQLRAEVTVKGNGGTRFEIRFRK